jgi:WD40 repeat protein
VQTLLGQTIDDLDLTGLLDETAHDTLDHTGLTGVPAAYTHPTGDGNLHVPATSTTNSGKVLTAGATAGALSWETPASGGGGDSYAPGDVLITGDTTKTTPVWVDAEGQALELGVYPELDLLFPGASGFVSTKLTDPSTLPTSTGWGTSFSPDGTYLAVAHSTSPYITIYKRSGDTFTKLADPATLPPNNGLGTAFSPDGTYLAVAHDVTPFIAIYKGEETLILPDLTPTDTRLKAKIYTGETA